MNIKYIVLFMSILVSSSLSGQNLGVVDFFAKLHDANGNLSDNDNLREVKYIGDLNNDGISDLAVGAPYDDDGGVDRGAVWIMFMGNDGQVQSGQKISDLSGNFSYPLVDNNYFGYTIGTLGDLDGDGVPDLAVGSWADDEGASNEGAVWIIMMNANGTVKSYQKINSLHGNFSGSLGGTAHFGISIGLLNDFNSDGYIEIAVGSSALSDGGINRGAVWILSLTNTGLVHSYTKISSTTGGFTGVINNNDRFGRGVTSIGDLNNDGVIDIAVGAVYDSQGGPNCGAVWIIFMNINGTVKSYTKICNNSGGFPAYLNENDYFGMIVSSGVDISGDGEYELVVSSHSNDWGGTNRGAVWVLSLNSNGTVGALSLLCSDTQGFTNQLDNEDGFASGLSFVPQASTNQRYNLSVGAGGDDDGGTDRGAVYNLKISQDFLTIPEVNNGIAFNVFPNPLEDRLNILFSESTGSSVEIVIADISGRVMSQRTVDFPVSKRLQLDLPDMLSGVYFLQIYIDGRTVGSTKIIR